MGFERVEGTIAETLSVFGLSLSLCPPLPHPTQPPPKICSDFRHNYNLLFFLQKARPLLQQYHDTYPPLLIKLTLCSTTICFLIFICTLIRVLANFIPSATPVQNGATFLKNPRTSLLPAPTCVGFVHQRKFHA